MYSGLLDSEGEGEGGMIWENGIETCILSCRKQITVYVQCRIQHAWGWCTGMTQRDDMGREVGGGFMFGNACTPVVDSCQCMAKPIQDCKVKWSKNKNLKKNNALKKKIDSLRDIWDNIKHTNICIIWVPKNKREKRCHRIYWKT